MQDGHDHFERRASGELRVRVDGMPAAVLTVSAAFRIEARLRSGATCPAAASSMALSRTFGEEVVKGPLVDPAM